jgi:5-methylcytosine-specific restriction endonuclease McrA
MVRGKYIAERYPILPPRGTWDVQSERIGPWWTWFKGYLESPLWQKVRKLVITAAKGLCQRCKAAPATDAHHLTYVRVGHERWGDLEAVCTLCHQDGHGRTW